MIITDLDILERDKKLIKKHAKTSKNSQIKIRKEIKNPMKKHAKTSKNSQIKKPIKKHAKTSKNSQIKIRRKIKKPIKKHAKTCLIPRSRTLYLVRKSFHERKYLRNYLKNKSGVGYIDSFFEYVRMLHYSILKKRFKLILKNRNRKITRKQEKKIRVNSLQLVRRTRIFRITKNLRTRIFRITKNLRTRKFISKNSRKTPNYQIKNVKLTYRKALYRRSYIRGRFFRNVPENTAIKKSLNTL